MLRSLATAAFAIGSTFAVSTAASAAHCSNYREVASYAHDLDYAANDFHEAVHDVTGYSHLADDAHELAYSASAFHDRIEFGADCWQIQNEFHELSHTYQHLSRAWSHAHQAHHHPYLHHDWNRVEEAYANLQWTVRSGR